MRQNAYTFRTAYYNSNDTKKLNKKISLPPAFEEYTPAITFRNNFATPAMSAMRGTLTLPGLAPVNVINNNFVAFNFNVPIVTDIGPARVAGRPVKTTTITITPQQLSALPVEHMIAIANQLAYLPASPSRDAFAPVLYKGLQDAKNVAGAYGLLAEIDNAINLLTGIFPVVAVAPIVVVPGGGVPVPAPVGAPVGAPVPGPPAPVPGPPAPVPGPPAPVPGPPAPVPVPPTPATVVDEPYAIDELVAMDIKKPIDFKNWYNTIEDTKIYKTVPAGRPVLNVNSVNRANYVAKWINQPGRMLGANYKVYIQNKMTAFTNTGKTGDPEGVFSNVRGYIHISEI